MNTLLIGNAISFVGCLIMVAIGFLKKKKQILIAGDTIFCGSIGRTDLYGGDYATLIKSITENILTLPDDLTVYPGHGGETTVGFERKHNPYLA